MGLLSFSPNHKPKSLFLFLALSASHSYREAYVCDTTRLAHRLKSNSLTSSTSDRSAAAENAAARSKHEEDEVTGQERNKKIPYSTNHNDEDAYTLFFLMFLTFCKTHQ